MNRLPAEVCHQIAAVCNDGLSALAATSRVWQFIVERQIFRRIKPQSTELQSFESIVTDQRRIFVDSINYKIVLPRYSSEAQGRFERDDDRRRNDESFTAAILGLFRILAKWDDCAKGFLELVFTEIGSPTDPDDKYDRILIDSIGPHAEERKTFRDLGNRRFRYSYLALLRPSELPEVACIGSLGTNKTRRAISHRAAVDMAAKLSHLRNCDFYMCDEALTYPALRRGNRLDFADALQETLPRGPISTLQSFCLDMDSFAIWDPAALPANLGGPKSIVDPFSHALWTATATSTHLKVLELSGVFDESLFWPDLRSKVVEPFWQDLQRLHVDFHFARPAGGWYFCHPSESEGVDPGPIAPEDAMPPGYGSTEEQDVEAAWQYSDMDHRFLPRRHRSSLKAVPDEEALGPMMEAFARACLQIPDLKTASLRTLFPVSERGCVHMSLWGVWYLAPGHGPPEPPEELDPVYFEQMSLRRLIWDVKDWKPQVKIQEILQQVGRERHGDELVEKFVDNWQFAKMWDDDDDDDDDDE